MRRQQSALQIGNRNSVGGPKRDCGLRNRKKRSLLLIAKETNCCAVLITHVLLGQTFILYSLSSSTCLWLIFAVVLFCFVSVVLLFHVCDLLVFPFQEMAYTYLSKLEIRQLFDTFLFLTPYIQSVTNSDTVSTTFP